MRLHAFLFFFIIVFFTDGSPRQIPMHFSDNDGYFDLQSLNLAHFRFPLGADLGCEVGHFEQEYT